MKQTLGIVSDSTVVFCCCCWRRRCGHDHDHGVSRRRRCRVFAATTATAAAAGFVFSHASQVLQTPWWILPVELLHGLTFAAMWAATTDYAYQISPGEACNQQRLTRQSLKYISDFGFLRNMHASVRSIPSQVTLVSQNLAHPVRPMASQACYSTPWKQKESFI